MNSRSLLDIILVIILPLCYTMGNPVELIRQKTKGKRIKNEGLNKQDITDLLQNQQKLAFLKKRMEYYNAHVRVQ